MTNHFSGLIRSETFNRCMELVDSSTSINIVGKSGSGKTLLSQAIIQSFADKNPLKLNNQDLTLLDQYADSDDYNLYIFDHLDLISGKPMLQKMTADFIRRQTEKGNQFIFEHIGDPKELPLTDYLTETLMRFPVVYLH